MSLRSIGISKSMPGKFVLLATSAFQPLQLFDLWLIAQVRICEVTQLLYLRSCQDLIFHSLLQKTVETLNHFPNLLWRGLYKGLRTRVRGSGSHLWGETSLIWTAWEEARSNEWSQDYRMFFKNETLFAST